MRHLIAIAIAATALAGAARADSFSCVSDQSGPDWRVRQSAGYVDGALAGSAMIIDIWGSPSLKDPHGTFDFNTIVGGHDPLIGWVRLASFFPVGGAGASHVSVDVSGPEIYRPTDSMLAGIDGKATPPPLALGMRLVVDGKPALSGAATVGAPPRDFPTRAARVATARLGDLKGVSGKDAEATDLTMKVYGARSIRGEVLDPEGKVAASFDLRPASVQAAMAARAAVRAENERKLKAGECRKVG